MYDELVKRLRYENLTVLQMIDLMDEAADALEEMNRRLDRAIELYNRETVVVGVDAKRRQTMELKPCPFCGGKPYMAQNYLGQMYVRCPECGACVWGKDTDDWRIATMGKSRAEKAAAEAWNRRAEADWIKFKTRGLDPEEQEEHPNWTYIMDCKLPDDGEEILVSNGRWVWTDTFCDDGDGCYLDGDGDLEELWWMPLPKPPKEERA